MILTDNGGDHRAVRIITIITGTVKMRVTWLGWSSVLRSLWCYDKDENIVVCEDKDGMLVDKKAGTVIEGGKVRRSYHSHCSALDIVWLAWAGGDGVPVYSRPRYAYEDAGDVTAHRRLVAVEAGLRKWFGFVLNRGIAKHRDHFHVDNACSVALRVRKGDARQAYRSCHFFLRDCISAFTDEKVDYTYKEGPWDSKSGHGYKTLLSDLGMECLKPEDYVNHYMLFLDYIMMHGFADKPAGTYRWGDNALVL